jgi:hypothetical protein
MASTDVGLEHLDRVGAFPPALAVAVAVAAGGHIVDGHPNPRAETGATSERTSSTIGSHNGTSRPATVSRPVVKLAASRVLIVSS